MPLYQHLIVRAEPVASRARASSPLRGRTIKARIEAVRIVDMSVLPGRCAAPHARSQTDGHWEFNLFDPL
jgi:hypothetical protein